MYNGAVEYHGFQQHDDNGFTPQQDYIAPLIVLKRCRICWGMYVPDEDFQRQTAARAFAKVQTFTINRQNIS